MVRGIGCWGSKREVNLASDSVRIQPNHADLENGVPLKIESRGFDVENDYGRKREKTGMWILKSHI